MTGTTKQAWQYLLSLMIAAGFCVLALAPGSAQTQALSAYAERLQTIKDQVRAGALQLAVKRLELEAPPAIADDDWLNWSRQKWSLYVLLEDWQALYDDVQRVPPGFPAAMKNQAQLFQARALMGLGQSTKASLSIQALLNQDALEPGQRKAARRLQIDQYQLAKDHTNANIAAGQYHSEFKPQETAWFIQRGLIAIQAGEPETAVTVLAPIVSPKARVLQAYARLKDGSALPAEAAKQVAKQLAKKRVDTATGAFGQAVIVAAALAASDDDAPLRALDALESYLPLASQNDFSAALDFTADDLVRAYRSVAENVMNRTQLVLNQDSQWLELASQLTAKNGEATAVYSTLLLQTKDDAVRATAMTRMVKQLLKRERTALIRFLFGDYGPLGSFAGLDSQTGALLLNHALADNDTDFIASLAPHLGEAPLGVDPNDWLLQLVRIDVFTGRFTEAEHKFDRYLNTFDRLSGEQTDRILQPVFDLQAISQHDIALRMITAIAEHTNSKKHQREMLFWQAESHNAKGDRLKAASLFMQSAMDENNGFDDWGQSARYHAAEALLDAHYFADARALLEGLLEATNDETRQATIRQTLQRLWLLERDE